MENKITVIRLALLNSDREGEIKKAIERDAQKGIHVFAIGNRGSGIHPHSLLAKFPNLSAVYIALSKSDCWRYTTPETLPQRCDNYVELGDIQTFRSKTQEGKDRIFLSPFWLPNLGILQHIHYSHRCEISRSQIAVITKGEGDRQIARKFGAQYIELSDYLKEVICA